MNKNKEKKLDEKDSKPLKICIDFFFFFHFSLFFFIFDETRNGIENK